MRYKQKLAMVEAYQYDGDFKKLSDWYITNSISAALPFYYIGRVPQIFDDRGQGVPIIPGCYLILSVDKKSITLMSQKEFEAGHVIPKEGGEEKKE